MFNKLPYNFIKLRSVVVCGFKMLAKKLSQFLHQVMVPHVQTFSEMCIYLIFHRLTAFALRVFCKASEFIHVDEKGVICKALSWLSGVQQAGGSFGFTTRTYHTTHFMVSSTKTCFY